MLRKLRWRNVVRGIKIGMGRSSTTKAERNKEERERDSTTYKWSPQLKYAYLYFQCVNILQLQANILIRNAIGKRGIAMVWSKHTIFFQLKTPYREADLNEPLEVERVGWRGDSKRKLSINLTMPKQWRDAQRSIVEAKKGWWPFPLSYLIPSSLQFICTPNSSAVGIPMV